ncbi:MAG: amidohydrolase family protein [Gammaproteobacteria bacterium]|nr:amidohydrolase family protein [Gammaproteobacteria bacterium]
MQPISADSHVVEAADVFVGLPERFGDDAPRIMYAGTDKDAIIIPSKGAAGVRRRIGIAGLRARDGAEVERRTGYKPNVEDMSDGDIVKIMSQGYDGIREGIKNGAERPVDQDIDGIAAEFLYPGFFGLFSFENLELLVACQKNYNDWLHDYSSAAGGRLFGLAAIPIQDPDAAVAELQRVVKMGFKGGCIPCTSPPEHPYHDDMYDPVWAAAEEARFPLAMHVGTNAYTPKEFRQNRALRDPVGDYAQSQISIQRTLVELIVHGVATKFPNLQFVVAEFNGGWIAHWLDRIEQGLQREYSFRGKGAYTGEKPHDIWARQFWATIEDDRPAILTRELIGTDNLMWGSDYPHVDSTWPCSLSVLDEVFADVSSEDRDKITRTNVERLYGLTN